jgi:hypothetical protein
MAEGSFEPTKAVRCGFCSASRRHSKASLDQQGQNRPRIGAGLRSSRCRRRVPLHEAGGGTPARATCRRNGHVRAARGGAEVPIRQAWRRTSARWTNERRAHPSNGRTLRACYEATLDQAQRVGWRIKSQAADSSVLERDIDAGRLGLFVDEHDELDPGAVGIWISFDSP